MTKAGSSRLVSLGWLLESNPDLAEFDQMEITGLALDSRMVAAGDLFIARDGAITSGLAYIAEAESAGAVAVIFDVDSTSEVLSKVRQSTSIPLIGVEKLSDRIGEIAARFYGQPSKNLFVAGITGTNGKTSCAHYLAQALSDRDYKCAVVGTLGNGFVGQLSGTQNTTPDAITLHRTLAELYSQGADAVAMEVSSHGLDQGRVQAISFNVALFTNLTRDHLDYHGDMQSYFNAKAKLLSGTGLDSVVVNLDDPRAANMLGVVASKVSVFGYSLTSEFESIENFKRAKKLDEDISIVLGTQLQADDCGIKMQILSERGSVEVRSKVLGSFNASNLLAVAAIMLAKGDSPKIIGDRLSNVEAVHGRLEAFGGEKGLPTVVVDYAHTPEALKQALTVLRDHCSGRLICLFGCGGDRDSGKRPLMGEIALLLSDSVVLTDDNPRTEDGDKIISEIIQGIADQSRVEVIRDRAAAIDRVLDMAREKDLVLIAGKGHEKVQIVGDKALPFSDRETVQRMLARVA